MKKFAFTAIVLAAAWASSGTLAQQKMDDIKDMARTPPAKTPMAMSHYFVDHPFAWLVCVQAGGLVCASRRCPLWRHARIGIDDCHRR